MSRCSGNKKSYIKNSLIVLFMYCVACLNISQAETTKVYTVGVVPQFEARRLYAIWKPLLDQLEKDTGLKFKFQGSPSIPAFEKKLLAGKFDFAYMNPYHLVWSQETEGYDPLVRDYSKKLHGILVVRKDDPITDIKQLDGKVLAFPAPNALGASLMMRAELHNKYAINIIPRYVKTHDSVYLNVLYKMATAGGGIQKTMNRQKPEIADKLRVLYRTHKVAPHPFGAHARVDNNVVKLVQQALLNMANTKTGVELLAKVPIKQIGTASMNDYIPLSRMHLKNFRSEN